MKSFLQRLFGRKQKAVIDEAALRVEFKSRYNHFQQLLRSDRVVHECMVEIEDALCGDVAFGMRFVRRRTAQATTATRQVVDHLMALAPGRYETLLSRFKGIQTNILGHIEPPHPSESGPLTVDLQSVTRAQADLVGLKMASLGEASASLGIAIPKGFVVTSEAYRRFMDHQGLKQEIQRRIQAAELDDTSDHEETLFQLASSVQQLIIQAPLPDDVAQAITREISNLSEDGTALRVAMRSSGLGEDQAGAAFAGQYKSKLNVSLDEALISYKAVVASKYGRQAMSYRLKKGIRDEDAAMCVGVMRMVDAQAGGVAYSAGAMDPLDLSVTIYSTWGLPKMVVDGAADVDLFRYQRTDELTPLEKAIANKQSQCSCREDEGTCFVDVTPERCRQPSLSDAQAKSVAKLALTLDDHFGTPQDIEWAIDQQDNVILLQSRTLVRPMEALQPRGDFDNDSLEPVPTSPLMSGGATASPLVACGPVYKARTQADLLLFPPGSILVVRQALPSWAPLMNRASGIISEMGSAAGHLANVAREFGVPALFGLKDALSNLENGTEVTLDANNQKIYPGRIEGLLGPSTSSCNPMKASPVYASLRGAARHILPLHLLEPDSPEFRPRNCESLHDIIRFSHEMSVREMFMFGQDKDFPQAAAKQLYHNGPKQFWVLNLDDGFSAPAGKRFIQLDSIVSIPMLALWEGMHAVSWDGPPPVDTKGFLSVMFEATANPSLEPAMASLYTQKNYFMISRHFTSLQSRFGFHFCGVEALVGDEEADNYAGFQFQGGAADRTRRRLRAKLIADLLQERDFRIKLHGDALTARVEGFGQAAMQRRLRALGYLIIHTRQLDMIMGDRIERERRKESLRKNLDHFFTQ